MRLPALLLRKSEKPNGRFFVGLFEGLILHREPAFTKAVEEPSDRLAKARSLHGDQGVEEVESYGIDSVHA
jgi:hypothetical protein